jgi:hypothetical protein
MRSRRECYIYIKMDLKIQWELVDKIHLAQDKDLWQVLDQLRGC